MNSEGLILPQGDRRTFLKTATAAGTLAALAQFPAGVRAAGGDTLKIGLVGCGGRGTGAAFNALHADPNTKIYAMADAFSDRLQSSLGTIKKKFPDRVDVPQERQHDGFDGYKKVIDACDVILLATPPHFRPIHLKECVAKGKHVFYEKPVAVDAPGVRSVIETAKEAEKKGICFKSGFCYRSDFAKRETIKRIHDKVIGDVVAIHVNYNTGPIWHRGHKMEWSEMEYQMRNWYYFTWLSGDHIVEQHCHNHDKAAWVMNGEMPIAAVGLGGRQVRTEPKYGNIFDHFSVVYEYASGVKLFSFCRQMKGCTIDVSDHIMCTKGSAQLMEHRISGAVNWSYNGPEPDMYDQEHKELFATIRAGQIVNDGLAAAHSTMMSILGRMVCYSGQRIAWKEAIESTIDLSPAKYEWGPHAANPVAKPGVTKVV